MKSQTAGPVSSTVPLMVSPYSRKPRLVGTSPVGTSGPPTGADRTIDSVMASSKGRISASTDVSAPASTTAARVSAMTMRIFMTAVSPSASVASAKTSAADWPLMVTAVGSWVTVNEMPSSLGWAKKSTKTPKICTGSVVSTSASSSANCAVSRKSILKMAPSMLSSLSSMMSWLLAKRSSLPSSSNSIAQSPG